MGFDDKPVDSEKMDEWLSLFRRQIHSPGHEYTPSLEEMTEVINATSNSAPGPDGIPFQAYKATSDTSSAVLHKVVKELLSNPSLTLPDHFNAAILVLLPKKPSFVDPLKGDVYSPENMRPLSIVNTYNRIIANSLRLTLEKLADNFISHKQRGFMKGRLITENLVDIDYASHQIRIKGSRGALVLFDFKAAFPSINHHYMWSTLAKCGVPPNVIQAYRYLYCNNHHTLQIGKHQFPSVTVRSGVRQGCPLSPLLFVICIEPLLERLELLFPDSTIRAFADDIGGTFTDIEACWPLLVQTFEEFKLVSGLEVHTTKTTLLPLFDINLDLLRETHWLKHSKWSQVTLDFKAKYLGIIVGPAATPDDSYQPALEKMAKKLQLWGPLSTSLFYKVRIWNVFLATITSYVDQFFLQPRHITDAANSILTKTIKGVHGWTTAESIGMFGKWFDFPIAARIPKLCNLAAITRAWTALGEKGIQIEREVYNRHSSRHPEDTNNFYNKFPQSIVTHMSQGFRATKQLGLDGRRIDEETNIQDNTSANNNMNNHEQVSDEGDHRKRKRISIQKKIYEGLLDRFGTSILPQTPTPTYPQPASFHPERLCRSRWEQYFNLNPERGTTRDISKWMNNTRKLKNKVPPRVHATAIRLGYHGWPCAARTGTRRCCRLCGKGEDSLGHLSRCPVATGFLSQLTLTSPFTPRHFFMTRWSSTNQVILLALGLHAIYDLLNCARHGSTIDHSKLEKQLWEHTSAAASGSAYATKLYLHRVRFNAIL